MAILIFTSVHRPSLIVQFVSEASATLKRRAAGAAEDVWLKSNLYPDYYLNTFHFQVRICIVPDSSQPVWLLSHLPLSQLGALAEP